MIVGLSGRKQSGKDTAANLLTKELGFERIAFADKLKELAAGLLGIPLEQVLADEFKSSAAPWLSCTGKQVPMIFPYNLVASLVSVARGARPRAPDDVHVESISMMIQGRDVLQRLGAAARNTFGEDFWVRQVVDQLPPAHSYVARGDGRCDYDEGPMSLSGCCGKDKAAHKNIVITDVRFFNELTGVLLAGGKVLRLNRADRKERHAFMPNEELDICSYLIEGDECGLKRESHPSHYSGDTHESETQLPDSGSNYAAVIEGSSAEETAQKVLEWVKSELGQRSGL